MFLPGRLFQGFDGLVGSGPLPALRKFGSDLVLRDHVLVPQSVAGGGNGDTLFHGIKLGLLFEFLTEFLPAGFEKFDV